MSRSSEIKLRFLAKPGKNRCCHRAFASGLAAAATVDGGVLRLSTADSVLAEGMADAILLAFRGDRPQLLSGALGFTLAFSTSALLSYVAAIDTQPDAPLVLAKCKDCRTAFLRGLFVGAGHYSMSARGFRLEFSAGVNEARLSRILSEFEIPFSVARRRKEIVLYTASSTNIEDFFGMLGDTDTYFAIANELVRREIRNDTTRIANCEVNNIKKAVDAAEQQCAAISYLASMGLLESLPSELAETARLRLAHPDLSLAQLVTKTVPRISKPGLSHRLRRLVLIADEYRSEIERQKGGEA